MIIKIYCDGGARENPGPAACAFVVRGKSGKPFDKLRTSSFDFAQGKYLGVGTNNEAEYWAVIEAWGWINESKNEILRSRSGGTQDDSTLCCHFFLDSKLVVNQINGNFKVKEPRLQKLLLKVRAGENSAGIKASYEYIPREKNLDADRLVNQTLDEA